MREIDYPLKGYEKDPQPRTATGKVQRAVLKKRGSASAYDRNLSS